jgi:hypothetical protein
VEHSANLVDLFDYRSGCSRIDEVEVMGHEKLTFQFGEGALADADEATQLPVTLSATALREVAADRECRPSHLNGESESFICREWTGGSVE